MRVGCTEHFLSNTRAKAMLVSRLEERPLTSALGAKAAIGIASAKFVTNDWVYVANYWLLNITCDCFVDRVLRWLFFRPSYLLDQ